jgi:GTP-binding protein Era
MKRGFVALVGRPNAGKSTLLNRLIGQKLAIVSDKPQTTRNRIVGVRRYPGGEVVFIDTPGIHRPLHRMNVRMVDMALDALRDADVVVAVVDGSEPSGAGDRFLMDIIRKVRVPRVLALNKVDRTAKTDLLPRIAGYDETVGFADIVPISALTGENVDRLEAVLLDHLPEGEPVYPEDYLTDQPEPSTISARVLARAYATISGQLSLPASREDSPVNGFSQLPGPAAGSKIDHGASPTWRRISARTAAMSSASGALSVS